MKITELFGDQLLDLADEVVGRGGVLAFRARGHSMAPIIADGDQVLLGPLAPGGARIGEVVLIRTDSGPRLHRLVQVDGNPDEQLFVARGDAPGSSKDRIPGSAICGRVVRINRPWWRWLSPRLVFRAFTGNSP